MKKVATKKGSTKTISKANAELKTSDGKLQSTNEELSVVIQELSSLNKQVTDSLDLAQAILATMHGPLIVLDRYLRVRIANKSFYNTFKVDEPETEGVMIYDLGNRQWDIPQLRILLENILPEKTIITNFEITHRFSHIGQRTISVNARELIEEDASQRLILISFDDITKEKSKAELLNQAVNRRTAELEALNKELLAFAYISSHDLQEPLRKILIFTGRILHEEQKNLSLKANDYFDRIQDAAERMQKLIEDLLAFSRLNSTEKIFEKIDLKTIVNAVKDELKDIIKAKRATIEIADLSTVGVIPFQFRQLLQNLISNALKFSRKDVAPYIVISSLVVEGKSVSGVTLVPDNKYYHICIKDNGIGFKPEYKDKIFEVFQKLHTLKDYSGTGIGLAIVKKIVENHQGIITATGVVDKGTIFDIYLPIL